jgi:hypothetical protein
MTKVVAQYRQNANIYREMAAQESRQDDKRTLETIAEAWEKLANLRERDLDKDE